jgi:hypothetical protein
VPNKNDQQNQNDMNRQNQQNPDKDMDHNRQGGMGQQQGGNAGQQSGQRQSGRQIDDNQDDLGRDVNQPNQNANDPNKSGRSGA